MRRVMAAAVLAVAIASGAVVMQRVMSIAQPSPCDHLDPNDNWFQWWYYGCDGGSAPGGGGSGAGEL